MSYGSASPIAIWSVGVPWMPAACAAAARHPPRRRCRRAPRRRTAGRRRARRSQTRARGSGRPSPTRRSRRPGCGTAPPADPRACSAPRRPRRKRYALTESSPMNGNPRNSVLTVPGRTYSSTTVGRNSSVYERHAGHCGSAHSTSVTSASGEPSTLSPCGMPVRSTTVSRSGGRSSRRGR